MITSRTTESKWVASEHDPAFFNTAFTSARLQKYIETRRLQDVGIDESGRVNDTGEMVTLFKVRPMKRELAHLIKEDSPAIDRLIFAAHVDEIKNADFQIEKDESGNIKADILDKIGMDYISDIAHYVRQQVEGKNGSTVPFSSRAGWRADETRLRVWRAMSAIGDTNVSGPDTTSK